MSEEDSTTNRSVAFDVSFGDDDKPRTKMPACLKRKTAAHTAVTSQMLADKQEKAQQRRKVDK